jgi:thiol-disulfide isomerase/thioredoxin
MRASTAIGMRAGWLIVLAGLTGAAAAEAPPPRNAILLFVASWCAPCHGEVRALPAIARAASPMRVIVVPIDARRGTERLMADVPPGQQWRLSPAAATATMRRLAKGAPGLPTSVAIDAEGEVCAVARRPLSPATALAIRRRCEAE